MGDRKQIDRVRSKQSFHLISFTSMLIFDHRPETVKHLVFGSYTFYHLLFLFSLIWLSQFIGKVTRDYIASFFKHYTKSSITKKTQVHYCSVHVVYFFSDRQKRVLGSIPQNDISILPAKQNVQLYIHQDVAQSFLLQCLYSQYKPNKCFQTHHYLLTVT